MGKYTLQANRIQKVFHVSVEGSMSSEDGANFIKDYKQKIAGFNPKEYVIELDCTKLNVTSADVLPMLEDCYKLYIADGFTKVIFTISKNVILKMQLSRVARNTGLTNYEIKEV
ncbi:hypothetical protein [Bacillus thuringiensis]|uniref:hypothetical protein n=1 Tax=Bacillus thuringiensis TaxID=1428 RepID=UPI0011A8DFD6|nr:hypothetical protein [Bacillus thuringiensis]